MRDAPVILGRPWLWVGLGLYVLVVVANAWMCDDAYICLRTIDNCVNGYGLRWNPSERVQTYTCPLWVLLLTPFYAITHEAFLTTIAVSVLVSATTAVILVRGIASEQRAGFLVLAVLVLSKANVDFATSGLENPLTNLLLVLFGWVFVRNENSRRSLFALSLLTGLGLVNRMDTALLFFPGLALAFWRQRSWRACGVVLAGMTPFIAWEGFAVLYYGFPFPNTAYAKLGTRIPALELAQQGGRYLWNSFQMDPLTLCVILVGSLLPFVTSRPGDLMLSAGCVLYLLYVVKVGGDFMSGRFLAAPLFLALVPVANLVGAIPLVRGWVAPVAVLVLGMLCVQPPLLARTYRSPRLMFRGLDSGIANEVDYYQDASLFGPEGIRTSPEHEWADFGRTIRQRQSRLVVFENVGYLGYFAGPDVEILDPLALTDPFLARLPPVENPDWRIGHFIRRLPPGYIQTLTKGVDHFPDKHLGEYHARLTLVTRGQILDFERLCEIWRLNTRQHDHLLASSPTNLTRRQEYRLSSLPTQPSEDRDEPIYIDPAGLLIDLQGRKNAKRLELSLGVSPSVAEIIYLDGEEELGREHYQDAGPAWTLRTARFEVPAQAWQQGVTHILIQPRGAIALRKFGHLRLLD